MQEVSCCVGVSNRPNPLNVLQAERLRQEARGTPPGIERDRMIRRARQAETALHVNEWLSSPGLRAPK